jgi:hypothetical protein
VHVVLCSFLLYALATSCQYVQAHVLDPITPISATTDAITPTAAPPDAIASISAPPDQAPLPLELDFPSGASPGSLTSKAEENQGENEAQKDTTSTAPAENGGLGAEAITGGVIAAVLVVMALIAIFIFMRRKRKSADRAVPSGKTTVRLCCAYGF